MPRTAKLKIKHRMWETYVATGDGTTVYSVPSGTDVVEKVVVAGRELRAGLDYVVEGDHSLASPPERICLTESPRTGDNIIITGIVWA